MRLSVVIATYNRSEELISTLNSFLEQKLDRSLWEVLVVNNNSTDNTEELFAAFIAKNPNCGFRIIFEPRQGLSYARNCGIDNTTADVIVMVDDDVQVENDFLTIYYDFFTNNSDAAASGGRVIPKYNFKAPKWLSPFTEKPIGGTLNMGARIKEFGTGYPTGCNMAFRRSAVERSGGFNTSLGRTGGKLLAGEEKDFFDRIKRCGGRVFYLPTAIVYHIIPKERFSKEYFDKVTLMIGCSERIRTKSISTKAYCQRLLQEVFRWGATVIISLVYLLCFKPMKGVYLIRMRYNITKGLLR